MQGVIKYLYNLSITSIGLIMYKHIYAMVDVLMNEYLMDIYIVNFDTYSDEANGLSSNLR